MNLARPLIAALAVIGLVCVLGPWWSFYEFDADEGLNLQKAVLVAQGYKLYADIWSDQPPFLTYVLAGVHLVFPFSIAAARATILLFAGLLAASLFRVAARFDGNAAGWGSVILLASSGLYLERSVTVMIGLPAIALAMLSIDLATSSRSGSGYYRIAAAGIAFALALLTKMFVLLILPALLAGLWLTALGPARADWRRAALATLWFLAAAAATIAVMFLATQGFSADQLFGTHIAARSSKLFDNLGGFGQLFEIVTKHASAAVCLAALLGVAAFWKRPASILLVPALWLATGLLALGTHQPLWIHQVLIVVPPLCWLGGVGLKSTFVTGERLRIVDMVAGHPNRLVRLAGWGLVLAMIPVVAILMRDNVRYAQRTLNAQPTIDEQMASTNLALFNDASDVLITDKPIDAYHLRKAVPPNLAVWSGKRVYTGRVTDDDVLREVEARPDSQVLLRRHAQSAALLERIDQHTPRVVSITGQYSPTPIVFFARPAGTSTTLESQLLGYLPEVAGKSLGGVTDPKNGWRLDRPVAVSPLPERGIVARPAGSAQELGACLVAASRVSQSSRLLLEALGVARALACVQTPAGGWQIASSGDQCGIRPGGDAKPNDILDDGTVPSILYFLFDLSDRLSELAIEQPIWLDKTIARGLDFTIRAQRDDGSWPQALSDDDGFHQLATLNDDAMSGMIRVLIAAYRRNANPALLDAARRGGEFLLRAQGTGDQIAFAQQYSPSLEPAPARKFEPAAYASLETAYAINALIDLHLATGDERYLAAAQASEDWLKRSEIEPTEWARLYEIGTNRPIYADRSGAVTYDLADLPPSEIEKYRWRGGRDVFPEIGVAMDRLNHLREGVASLQAFDEALAAASLLSATPTARLPLVPGTAAITPETLQSTRKFAEYCAGLIAAQKAEQGKSVSAAGSPEG